MEDRPREGRPRVRRPNVGHAVRERLRTVSVILNGNIFSLAHRRCVNHLLNPRLKEMQLTRCATLHKLLHGENLAKFSSSTGEGENTASSVVPTSLMVW